MKIRKKWSIGIITYTMTLFVFNYCAYLMEISFDRINIITLVLLAGIFLTGAYNEFVRSVVENKMILLFFIMYLFQVILSSVQYSQSLSNSFFSEKFYFILLLYYVMVRCFITDEDKEIVIDIYIIMSLFISFIINIQTLLLHDKGIEMIFIEYNKRAGGVRVLNSVHFIEIGILLSLSKIFNYWGSSSLFRRIIYIVTSISGIINVFFVSQTRMSIFIVLTIIGLLILLKETGLSRSAFAKRITIFFIIIAAFVYILNTPTVSVLIDDFGTNTVSISLRMEEVQLYLGQLFSSPFNLMFGLGMIHDTNTSYLYSVLGINGTGGRTDVGVIGFVNEFGVLGLLLYIWIVVRGYHLIKQSRGCDIKCHDLLALYLYFIFGSGTLFMFNRGRIFAMPIMLYLFRTYSIKFQEKNYYTIEDKSYVR